MQLNSSVVHGHYTIDKHTDVRFQAFPRGSKQHVSLKITSCSIKENYKILIFLSTTNYIMSSIYLVEFLQNWCHILCLTISTNDMHWFLTKIQWITVNVVMLLSSCIKLMPYLYGNQADLIFTVPAVPLPYGSQPSPHSMLTTRYDSS